MSTHRIKAVMMRHYYDMWRNVDRLTDMVYWPVLDIIVWGFFTIYLRRGNGMSPGVISFLLGATLLWGLFYSFQRDMAVGFLDELWFRNLANLFSTPLSVSEYVAGLILVNLCKTLIGFSLASAIAYLCYAFDVVPMLPRFLPYILNLILFGLALGVVITGLIFRYGTRMQALAWSFAGLLQPVSCVFYPRSALPRSLQMVASMLPTAHSFEGMRQVLSGGGFSRYHFWTAIALNLGYFAIAVIIFRQVFEGARNRGVLVKLE